MSVSLLQIAVLTWVPLPHDTEHCDHSDITQFDWGFVINLAIRVVAETDDEVSNGWVVVKCDDTIGSVDVNNVIEWEVDKIVDKVVDIDEGDDGSDVDAEDVIMFGLGEHFTLEMHSLTLVGIVVPQKCKATDSSLLLTQKTLLCWVPFPSQSIGLHWN
jgi:hypothetical protein